MRLAEIEAEISKSVLIRGKALDDLIGKRVNGRKNSAKFLDSIAKIV